MSSEPGPELALQTEKHKAFLFVKRAKGKASVANWRSVTAFILREGGQISMCTTCKKRKRVFSHPVPFTLILSAGLLIWLSTLFSIGAMLLR